MPVAATPGHNPSVKFSSSYTCGRALKCFSGNHASTQFSRSQLLRSPSSAGKTPNVSARAGLPPRLLAVLVPVCTAGALTLAWAAVSFAGESHSTGTLLGLAALLAASMFAERFPVPVEGADAGGVSLLYVFVVATTVLYG